MMEPLAVAWHAVKKANVKAGSSALIIGAGPVSAVGRRSSYQLTLKSSRSAS